MGRLLGLTEAAEEKPDDISIAALLDATGEAIIVADLEGKVCVASAGALRFLGEGEDITEAPLIKLLNERFAPCLKDPQAFRDWLELTSAMIGSSFTLSPSLARHEVMYETDGGQKSAFSVMLSAIRDLSGKRVNDLLIIQDITKWKRLEAILNSVAFAAKETSSRRHIRESMPDLFSVVREQIAVDAMAILLFCDDARSKVLGAVPDSFLGGADTMWSAGTCSLQEGVLMELVSDVEATLLETDSRGSSGSLVARSLMERICADGFSSMIILPLLSPDKFVGLWILAGKDRQVFGISDVDFLEPVSEYLAAAVHNATLVEKTREMYLSAVRALAAAVDTRDPYTMHHSRNVSAIAQRIGQSMRLSAEEIEVIGLAGLVHDIGKLGVPDEILLKPGPLDPRERAFMEQHSSLGAAILEKAGMLSELVPLVRHHHEWYDGTGYPGKLHAHEIPLGAAILSVADAFDTMVSDRLYRPGMSVDRALAEVRKCAGSQFHPEVAQTLELIASEAVAGNDGWLAEVTGYGDRICELPERESSACPATGRTPPEAPTAEDLSSRELGVLVRIAEEMGRLLDLESLLEDILNIVAHEMGYSNCAILLPDESGGSLTVSCGLGLSSEVTGKRIPRGLGIAWWVLDNGIPQHVPDVALDDRHYRIGPPAGSEIYVPLEVRGKRLGVLLVQKTQAHGFSGNDVDLLMAVGGHLASALEVGQLHENVKKAAGTDSLTGLYNRRAFLSVFGPALESVISTNRHLSVALIDVDDLKRINDDYGHLAGDAVLAHIGGYLKSRLGACDVAARYGGDEFVVLMPETTPESACTRIRKAVSYWSRDSIETASGQRLGVPGACFGVASYPEDGVELRVILSIADDRLLKMKGRRGVSVRSGSERNLQSR